MFYKLAAFTLAALLGAPLTATAIPIAYQIKFTTLTGFVTTSIYPDPLGPPAVQIEGAAGKVYFGLFAVDDEILMTDGIGKPGNVDFFYIQMEDNIWGYNLAVDNSFSGFRGPIPGDPFCMMTMGCLNAPSPGFDVVNGTITNLRGGVYGRSDVPFVDFSLNDANTFNAIGASFIEAGTTSTRVGGGGTSITGAMEIFRVPEPGALPLFGLGLVVLSRMIRQARRS
jgi:hypothetical protein